MEFPPGCFVGKKSLVTGFEFRTHELTRSAAKRDRLLVLALYRRAGSGVNHVSERFSKKGRGSEKPFRSCGSWQPAKHGGTNG